MEDWKKESINRLREHKLQMAAVENNAELAAAANIKMTRIRSADMDGTPVKGGGSTREDRMLNEICNIDRFQSQQAEAMKKVKAVECALSALSEEERHLLETAYVSGIRGGVERLREEYNFEDVRQVYRKIDAALERFNTAMHGTKDRW